MPAQDLLTQPLEVDFVDALCVQPIHDQAGKVLGCAFPNRRGHRDPDLDQPGRRRLPRRQLVHDPLQELAVAKIEGRLVRTKFSDEGTRGY